MITGSNLIAKLERSKAEEDFCNAAGIMENNWGQGATPVSRRGETNQNPIYRIKVDFSPATAAVVEITLRPRPASRARSSLLWILILLVVVLPCLQISGQSSFTIAADPPTRITDCATGQLVGSGFKAALFWAPSGTIDRSLFSPVGSPFDIVNGTLPGGNRTLPIPSGTIFMLYAAAWDGAFGSSYNEASLVPGARVGYSEIISTSSATTPPFPQARLPDFEVCPVAVPEPANIVLISLLALLSLRMGFRPKELPARK